MRGRSSKGAPSADLLVCFPSRAHLTLMPKPICSPARPSEPNHHHHHHHNNHQNHHHHHHNFKKYTKRGGAGKASPILWAKTKPTTSDNSEPTSPKVTCAGQIKVRPKAHPCKNWQSVMEEIEKLHNNRKHKKRPTWIEALGLKKEVMQFLTCLRNLRFDFRCFGAFPTSDITSDDDEEDEEEEEDGQENHKEKKVVSEEFDDNETSRTVFSKWFMVLQENQKNIGFTKEEINEEREFKHGFCKDESLDEPCAPPSNALLLMRCRSAPAKTWLEEREEEEEEEDHDDENEGEEREEEEEKLAIEEENREKRESLAMVMKYDADFYKLSSDIAKETWVVGGIKDVLSRSRSCKR